MKHKWMIYVGFFVVLTCVFLYFVFNDYDFSKSRLAVINPNVPDFSFVDQNGKVFNSNAVDGKVYVAEYFFTTCKGICPKMNANMRRVFDAYKNEKDFAIVSHTCQPEVDSIPLLKAYEKKILLGTLQKNGNGSYVLFPPDEKTPGVSTSSNWHFITGNKTELYRMARIGYMIDNGKPDTTQNISDQFIHTQFFSLVDKNRRVRGIYDGLKEEEINKLLTDIKSLLNEKVTSQRFMNGFSNNPN